MADKPYRDPKSTKIEDWKWRPLEQIKAELAMREIPDYIQEGFGGFMNEQAGRAKKGAMTPRDLIKAYTIAQSSIGRGGLSHATASKMGMKLPNTGGEVRPEGAFAEWLGSPEGQRYLDLAQKGEVDPAVIADLQYKFAPFGKQNDQAAKMVDAAHTMPAMAGDLNRVLVGSPEEYRDFAEKLKGIAGAKSGFIGSLLGRGDLPTLDARQLNLHTEGAPVGIGAIMARGKGKGAREAVDRLAARQAAMGLDIDPALAAHYQHLAHHAVWDKTAGAKTTHEDLIRAMRGYDKGGSVEPSVEEMQQALAQKGYLTHTPKNRNPVVGTRYRVGEATGLAPKAPVDLEQHKGASVMLMPWDSVSRNVDIHEVSGHELPEAVTTHGGHDFARDLEHIARGIAGASNEKIAKRIATREALARMENEKKGGTGRILHLPTTMGNYAEGFAMTPAELAFQLHQRAALTPEQTLELEELIRNSGPAKHFKGFVGLRDPEAYANQIRTGEGLDKPGKVGELRKLLNMKLIHGKRAQELMDFNAEDAQNAMLDPALRGVPKGQFGNTVIGSDPDHMSLLPSDSSRDPYDTRFTGEYLGTLGHSMPVEVLLKKRMDQLTKQFTKANKRGNIRNMVLGALEKRNNNVSQILDNETLDRYGKYLMDREKKLRTGHYAEGGEACGCSACNGPSQDEMLAHVMLHKAEGGAVDMKEVGAEEAPDMPVKEYVAPSGEQGLPIGGVDFQPEQPGKQLMPGAPQQPPGQIPGQPGQIPQQPAPLTGQPTPSLGGPQAPALNQPNKMLGGPPMPPFGQPRGPQSNILAMTPQGQAMQAMRPSPTPMPNKAPMPRMASGGAVRMASGGAPTTTDQKQPIGIDAFGDSTTWGYVNGQQVPKNMINTAQSMFGDSVKINNRGVNSTTLGDLLGSSSFRDALTNSNPIVILNYGMNEAYRAADPTTAGGNDPESFRANLMTAVQQLQDAGKKVILQTPNNTNSTEGWQGNVGSYANIISDVANQTGSALDDKYNTPITYSEYDTFHPSEEGYGILGQHLYSTINSVLNPTTQNAGTSTTDTTAAKPMTVEDLYYKVLGRAPDAEGLAYWNQQFGNEVDPNEASVFTGTAQNLLNQDPNTYASMAPNLTAQQIPQSAALPATPDVSNQVSSAITSPLDVVSNNTGFGDYQPPYQAAQPMAQADIQPMQYNDMQPIPEPDASPRSLRMQNKFEGPSLAYQPEQYMFAKGGSTTPSVSAMRHELAKKRATTHSIKLEERKL
jgi:lysophospholipase L1-like esterase